MEGEWFIILTKRQKETSKNCWCNNERIWTWRNTKERFEKRRATVNGR